MTAGPRKLRTHPRLVQSSEPKLGQDSALAAGCLWRLVWGSIDVSKRRYPGRRTLGCIPLIEDPRARLVVWSCSSDPCSRRTFSQQATTSEASRDHTPGSAQAASQILN